MAKQRFKPNPYWLAFQETVPKSFASIIADYGFLLTQPSNGVFELRSDVCLITIYLDRQSVLGDIKPARADQVPKVQYYSSIDLGMFIDSLAPQEHFDYRFCRKPEEIADDVAKLASLIQKYCYPTLKGDFSDWLKLKASQLKKLNIPF
ncbi:MAG: hypothetical protein HS126_01695 [Anaerolineales bacterium]|nr:hypothetical protein [Anaerolineales bacterium]